MARRLQRIDLFFGIAAVVVIVTGIARVVFGLKGADFYLHNPIFWTKMGLFLLVGLLSIAPTVHYLRWNAALPPAPIQSGTNRVPTGVSDRCLLRRSWCLHSSRSVQR